MSRGGGSKSLNAKAPEDGIVSLYRYFAWADYMRNHYQEVRERDDRLEAAGVHDRLPYDEVMRAEMYMCFWFASLYSVIEGWRKLRLQDSEISALLRSPLTETLREFRNAVYHPEAFDDKRLERLVATGNDGSDWIIQVTVAFRRLFNSLGIPDGFKIPEK